MNTTTQFLCIKTLTAPKTGLNAKGAITYAVLRDTASTDIYICLLGNEGGGYYSQEAVSLTAIEQCLAGLDPSGVIPSKVFKAAFSGKSVNNSGFLAAVLRSELLLQPNPDAAHQHLHIRILHANNKRVYILPRREIRKRFYGNELLERVLGSPGIQHDKFCT